MLTLFSGVPTFFFAALLPFRTPLWVPSASRAMADPTWTPAMDGVLLRYLSEAEGRPSEFPENPKGASQSVMRYFDEAATRVSSLSSTPVTSGQVRKRAAYYLAKLEPLSDVLVLVVRTTQAAQSAGTTVADLLETVNLRDAKRVGLFASKKRTVDAAAAEAKCTCGAGGVEPCPLSEIPHTVLRVSTPPAVSSSSSSGPSTRAPDVEEHLFVPGQPVTADSQRALLHTLRVLEPTIASMHS